MPSIFNRGVVGVGRDVEQREVAELESARATKAFKKIGLRSNKPEVDVLRRACALDARG